MLCGYPASAGFLLYEFLHGKCRLLTVRDPSNRIMVMATRMPSMLYTGTLYLGGCRSMWK